MTSAGGEQAWVEIEWIVLEPADRAAACPPDTRAVPYVARARGMVADPELGVDVEIVTTTGRLVRGRIRDVNPGYDHSFGRPLPEWIKMRDSIREVLHGDEEQS